MKLDSKLSLEFISIAVGALTLIVVWENTREQVVTDRFSFLFGHQLVLLRFCLGYAIVAEQH